MSYQEKFTTFSVTQDLYAAADAVLAEINKGLDVSDAARSGLATALAACDSIMSERDRFAGAVEDAREDWESDICKIDEEPLIAVADDAVWVSAWLRVDVDAEDLDPLAAKAQAVFDEHGTIDGDVQDSDPWEKQEDGAYEKVIYTVPYDAGGDTDLTSNFFRVEFDEMGQVSKFGYV
jgi:hypothetical protein